MGFGTWIPLILLILVPVIIILYMLKQKAQEYEFSSSLLWKEIYQNIEATKPWEKLKNNLLMILQILVILLMILTLMAPYLKAHSQETQNAILVIDCSASMNTRYDRKHTRLEIAKEKACDYIDGLGNIGNITVISSSNTGNLIITNSKNKTELKESIQKIEATVLPGTISDSLSLVQSAASQWENSQILIFTDTAFDAGEMKVGIVSLYNNDVVNLSMDYMSCSETENGLTVLVRMTNHSQVTQSREINLYDDEELLDIAQVALAPKETKVIYFEQVQPNTPILRAEFQEDDDLAEDNVVFCIAEENIQNQVLLVSESNLFLEKALLNLAGIEIFRTSDLSHIPSDEDSFDLYILDGISCKESDLPKQGNLLLINSNVDGITEKNECLSNRVLTFSESDLTGYIAEETFGVNEAICYKLPIWGNPFITSENTVIGFFGEYDGRRIGVMGFDLHKTDLGLQAPFPILMSNLMEYLLDHGLVTQNTFIAGDAILLNGSTKGGTLRIQNPDGEVYEMAPSLVSSAYPNANQLGTYFVAQEVEGMKKSQCFAVNFPVTTESNITSVGNVMENSSNNQEEILIEGAMDLKIYVLIFLIGLLFAEWYVYIKRT